MAVKRTKMELHELRRSSSAVSDEILRQASPLVSTIVWCRFNSRVFRAALAIGLLSRHVKSRANMLDMSASIFQETSAP